MMKFKIVEQNFFEKIDIFGIGINIRFNQKAFHKTNIGGIVTVIILFLMSYQVKLVVDNLTDYQNPTVLFEQRYTKSPERYNITSDNFSFMFGLQDPASQHFMDPSIYKITFWLKRTVKVLHPETGDYITKWNNRIVKTEPCTKQHFQVIGAQDYFLKLKFSSMYCISLDEKDIYLEGQFDAMSYSGFQIVVEACTGTTCKSPDQLQAMLNNGRMALYYIDHAVLPSDRQDPFQPLGRQSFWVSGPQFTKSLNIGVRNTYLQTDVGFLTQNIQEDRTLTWSFDREQTIPKVGDILYDVYVSFEKNINSVYKRSYVKFDRAVSQIGGAFNVLFAIGCLLCRPFSQLELNRKLINNIFNLEEDEDDNQEKKIKEKEQINSSNHNMDKQMNQDSLPCETLKENRNELLNQSCQNNKQRQLTQLFNSVNQNKSMINSQSIRVAGGESSQQYKSKPNPKIKRKFDKLKEKGQTKQEFENFFLQQNKSMEFKGYQYLLNFFKFCNICKNRKQQLIQKGVDKLYNHIDIFYLINKLIEVEKLKYLLLNEDQVKLFEFIPKPTLSLADKKLQSDSDKVNILSENNKTLGQKTADAHESFKKIVQKGDGISKIDVRLLELLDPRFKSYLKYLERNCPVSLETNTSQLVTNALESNKKIKLNPLDENDQIFKIPTEGSINENHNCRTISDSVQKIMLTYQFKSPNKNDLLKLSGI